MLSECRDMILGPDQRHQLQCLNEALGLQNELQRWIRCRNATLLGEFGRQNHVESRWWDPDNRVQ